MADEHQYQKNANVAVRPRAAVTNAPRKALPPLSEAEYLRIKDTIAYVKEKCPELVQMVKELHALGMIDGWRSVTVKKVENDID